MEYFVSMNEQELKTALLLSECTELARVIRVENDFSFDEELIQKMTEKRFLEIDNNQCKWNPFVEMLLYTAIHATCYMYQIQKDGSICNFYYLGDMAVMLIKKTGDSQYIFYLVSLVPKMIGGMAKTYETLEKQMHQTEGGIETEETLIQFEAFKNGERSYTADLIIDTNGNYILVENKNASVFTTEVDYYSMVKKISKVMIELHGCSIKMKEEI